MSDDLPPLSWRDGLLAFLFLAVVLGAVYSPVMALPYGFLDDYRCLELTRNHDPQYIPFTIAMGRPLGGLIIDFEFHRGPRLEDMGRIRIWTVLLLAVWGWVVWDQMRLAGWPRSIAMSAAVLLTTTPAAQVFAAWTVELSSPLAMLAGAGAATLAARAARLAGQSRQAVAIDQPRRRAVPPAAIGPAAAAAALLLVGLMIYQPGAMLYWIFAAIHIFSPRRRDGLRWRELAWYGAIAVPALGLEFIAFKVGQMAMSQAQAQVIFPGASLRRAGLVFHGGMIYAKLHWFIVDALTNSLNFGYIFPRRRIALATGLLMAGGLANYFDGGWRRRLSFLAVAGALVPLACIPNLLTAENWASYRSLVALASLLTVYAILAMQGWWKLVAPVVGRLCDSFVPAVLPALAALLSAASAAYLVTAYFAWPQMLELKLVQALLVPEKVAAADRILIVPPDWIDSAAPSTHLDEYGEPSTNKEWSATAMVRLILRERHQLRPELIVDFAGGSRERALAEAGPDVLVLDMRKLHDFRWSLPGD